MSAPLPEVDAVSIEPIRRAGEGDGALGIERTVGRLRQAIVDRSSMLESCSKEMKARREKARVDHERAIGTIRQRRTDGIAAAESAHRAAVNAAEDLAASKVQRLDERNAARELEIEQRRDSDQARLTRELEEKLLMAEAMREAGEEAELQRLKTLGDELAAASRKARDLDSQARAYLRRCRLKAPPEIAPPPPPPPSGARAMIDESLRSAEQHLEAILATRAARLLAGATPFILLVAVVAGAGVIGAAVTMFDAERWPRIASYSAGGALGVMLIIVIALRIVSVKAMRRVWLPFQIDLASIDAARSVALHEAEEASRARVAKLREIERREEEKAHGALDEPIADIPLAFERRGKRLAEATAAERAAIESERRTTRSRADAERTRTIAALESEAVEGEKAEMARAAEERASLDREERDRLADTRAMWIATATECRELLCAAERVNRRFQPAWGGHAPEPMRERAPWFRFGALELAPAALPGGLPADGEHHVEMPARIDLPAALGFPSRGNLVIETTPETRAAAIGAVQALVARLLTSIPPSKVRLTFVDPVGLGENFAAFMRLGDEFEQLVGERIWTEPRAIEQKLTDLSEHMETVIQKYLRNEFNDIDAYNEAAGEIAEPYRFLVCADFPANFSDQAAVRMNSILRAGQRCGVHVILLRDQKAALPDGLGADAIAESCQIVRAGPQGFRFAAGPFADLPLALDMPLSDDALIPLLARIGREAKSAARVEVPFDVIAPKGDAMWSLSSARNLKVPIGRAGATRLQQFLLGEGTSQHALIAGKTGSGKSTLLHAIITGLATWYSPDEVELWLVDFKKGVEFKTYAEHALPHARAVAIESDREFGLSVLEGLDGELSRRGELFREAGVQDIASFRRERPTVRMPRILLVIDEFQEFFLDDDKVAQGASMLLDRLVRQGRAFGMHALLGSQTLGGAYSLARSTMGQMGVRIALQCSETDSQLILSDENLAARLLSRPGEAIYNDAGGRTEGNSPFQVAFLPDEKRDGWLSGVESKAKGAYDALPRIVFEGDARAAMKLHPASKGGAKPDPRGNVRLWFGEAVAIKDPTCARLAKAAGANVAIISSRDDQSVSSALAAILSIAAEAPDATIDVLDGTPADAPEYGMLERAVTERSIKASFTAFRDVESRIAEVAADVNERGDAAGRARRFLVIHQLQRYRALRRNEDDFSFGGSDGPPSTDKLLVGILREGPATGVHTVVTCDTLASLQRTFDRNTIREFDWKVLFQLSPSDSSSLIDSPAASRLGTNRGLLHSEELGLLEKFRPYII
ncbi:MAG: hypothetical protein LW636_05430 [Planctomycetaceae bacterium]|nr:hypothetical protein [Planctomycetaceae bacterium]